jgi:6-pyruvoyltetrahydropterin/6-carboxytetrahydropterin synthase
MIYLTRRFNFSASHRLFKKELSDSENEILFGKCSNPNWHGHNYLLEVTVCGEPDPDTGFIVDIKNIKEVVNRNIIEKVDHKNMNVDVGFMKNIIPTTENIASGFWQILEPILKSNSYKLYSVKLFETENNFVEIKE